jgi:hypothetical protein
VMEMCHAAAMAFSSSKERPIKRPSKFFTQSPV